MKKWPRGLRCFLWFLCQGQKELLSKYVPGAPWLVLNKLSRNYGLLMENSRPLILLESLYGKTAIILVKETRFQLLFISVHPMTEYRDQGININFCISFERVTVYEKILYSLSPICK